ncbi:S-adenosyl-L-methionine-dependent methyltransferase [Thamnocephalis sphaerospora]|uniref:S-adenosyl-L-methionine-dependent methyltransferase n=1 Tax=Thamnocephalis sphaerospora TaxID=78915 RepID=A0A4P9XPL6_9FUNG|nr:S-adenosyl-L-methionine-dependent methyltransferase [Thamnocephalis sphaerospora]|eukprot:RKP07955.1 S-adenosyl-L-methionine-dependent methyltransferase [Thamnocephalis sphaerospora]
MIPTPDLGHLKASDYQHVYEPAEDTFLLLDALEQDQERLRQAAPRMCVEVGSGSGCVSAFLAGVIGKQNAVFLCTDVNLRALQATRQTGTQNQASLEPVRTDLVSGLRLQGRVDVLVFNPPYVPTPSEEVACDGIAAAWAGGIDGREVTDRLLPRVADLLSPRGVFYLVAVRENKPQEMIDQLAKAGLHGEVTCQRRSGPERLCVIRFTRRAGQP